MNVMRTDALITGSTEYQIIHHLKKNKSTHKMSIINLAKNLTERKLLNLTFIQSTVLLCPSSVRSRSPFLASRTLIVLSYDPTSRRRRAPSCDEARQLTARGP